MFSKNLLTGKKAIITGASSGLGEHFAELLAYHGAYVVLAARRKEKLEELEKCIQDLGGKAISVPMDVTSPDSVVEAFDFIENNLDGPCDILVNNSGVGQGSWFLNTEEEEWTKIIDTNLSGVWRVAQSAAQALVKAEKPGSIINIASITALRPSPMISGYAASKAAVIHLTRNMAFEMARYKIRVNSISPGYFRTPLNDKLLDSSKGDKMRDRIAMRRFGNYNDLDGPLLLLASDAGSYMTGTSVVVDGGHTLTPL